MNTDGNIAAIERNLADCEGYDDWKDLQDQLEAARADAKEAEAYAEELEKAMKKDYNDGTIHGWNGGDCPVHPETVVKVWFEVSLNTLQRAGDLDWKVRDEDWSIIAFQVVKQHVEPKVIWVNEYPTGGSVFKTEKSARHYGMPSDTRIAVKYQEVRE